MLGLIYLYMVTDEEIIEDWISSGYKNNTKWDVNVYIEGDAGVKLRLGSRWLCWPA